MSTRCDCCKKKRVLVEIDDFTLHFFRYFYATELSERAKIPSQCFILGMFQEMLEVVRYQELIDKVYHDLHKFEVMTSELESIEAENLDMDQYYDTMPLEYAEDDFFQNIESMSRDLHEMIEKLKSRYPIVDHHRKKISEKLVSKDSDADILEEVCASKKVIEKISVTFCQYKFILDDIFNGYRSLRCHFLSYIKQN